MENLAYMCFVKLLIVIILMNVITLSGNADAKYIDIIGISKTYCFSGISQNIICNYTSKIAILHISFERNCTSNCQCQITSNTEICQKFELPGSWKNYYYYKQLSGLWQGSFTTKPIKCIGSHTELIYSNRYHIEYGCVNDIDIINFCAANATNIGPFPYIKYDGEKGFNSYPRDCFCVASSTSGLLRVYAVDVRFQKYTVEDSGGLCERGEKSFLLISDETHNVTLSCQDEQIIGNYKNIFNSFASNITIHLHLEVNPQMIWIALKANNGEDVNVNCHSDEQTTSFSPTTEITTKYIISTVFSTIYTSTKLKTYLTTKRQQSTITSSSPQSIPTPNNQETTSSDANLTTESTSTAAIDGPHGGIAQSTTTFPGDTASKSDQKDNRLDPAVITLVIAGILTLVLIVLGAVLVRKKYQQNRIHGVLSENLRDRIMLNRLADDRKENSQPMNKLSNSNKDNVSTNAKSTDSEKALNGGNAKYDDSSGGYHGVQKSQHFNDTTNHYDKINNKLYPSLPLESDGKTSDKEQTNGHKAVSAEDILYSKIQRFRNDSLSNSKTNDGVGSDREKSLSSEDSNVNPYVDEVVRQGMNSEREAYRRPSSSVDFENNYDAAISDLVKHANVWAAKDETI